MWFAKHQPKKIDETRLQLDQAKEILLKQEKLAVIGQLAAGVAHEINNPLGYISSNIESSNAYFLSFMQIFQMYRDFIQMCPTLSAQEQLVQISQIRAAEASIQLDFLLDDIHAIFSDVSEGIDRIADIVASLKSFSRVDPQDRFSDYNINDGIRKTLLVTRNELKNHARVVESLENTQLVQAISGQIEQVLLNLILNAVDAIKAKSENTLGQITLTTESTDDHVTCRIQDTGTGIPADHLEHIFQPFFTTKPVGQGTGLGLTMAHDMIVNKHGGTLEVNSEEGIGTEFIIRLPIVHLPLTVKE